MEIEDLTDPNNFLLKFVFYNKLNWPLTYKYSNIFRGYGDL